MSSSQQPRKGMFHCRRCLWQFQLLQVRISRRVVSKPGRPAIPDTGFEPDLQRSGDCLYLRGIGTNLDFIGSDPSVTLHTDGVYQSRTSTVLNDLFDVDRVEVLRGAQGRSTAGTHWWNHQWCPVCQQRRRKPELQQTWATYQQTRIEAMASGALAAPQPLGRIAVLKADHDPYVDNLNPNGIDGLMDDDTFSSKGTLRYLMGDKGEFLLSGDYTQVDRATRGL